MPGYVWPYLGALAKESEKACKQDNVQGEAQPQLLKSLLLEKEMQDPWWKKQITLTIQTISVWSRGE